MTSFKRPRVMDTQIRMLVEHIDNYHEKFCMVENPEKKADALKWLTKYAADYLNNVTHSVKFQVQIVEVVLSQSIQSNMDFDPRKAGGAFKHLAKYGRNLLEQPWREDFKTVNLSTGYYVHNIEQYLHNPHEVLISMGYMSIDDSTLQLATLPNSDVLKKISQVSRDCFLASQECLILSQLLDHIQKETKQSGIPIAQVYEYRKEYVGDIATIGRTICCDIHELQQIEKQKDQACQYQQQQLDDRMEVDGDAVRGVTVGADIPDSKFVPNILRNMEREQEHVNVTVSVSSDPLLSKTTKYQMNNGSDGDNMHNLSPSSPSINSSPSNFIRSGAYSAFVCNDNNNNIPSSCNPPSQANVGLDYPEQQHQKVLEQQYYNSPTKSSAVLPNIVRTTSSYFSHTDQQSTTGNSVLDGGYNRGHNNSSSSNSDGLPYPTISISSTKLSQQNVALQKSKIPPEELCRMTANQCHYDITGSNTEDWSTIPGQRQQPEENDIHNPIEESASGWPCPHCTYLNYTEEDKKVCQVCNMSRDYPEEERKCSMY